MIQSYISFPWMLSKALARWERKVASCSQSSSGFLSSMHGYTCYYSISFFVEEYRNGMSHCSDNFQRASTQAHTHIHIHIKRGSTVVLCSVTFMHDGIISFMNINIPAVTNTCDWATSSLLIRPCHCHTGIFKMHGTPGGLWTCYVVAILLCSSFSFRQLPIVLTCMQCHRQFHVSVPAVVTINNSQWGSLTML